MSLTLNTTPPLTLNSSNKVTFAVNVHGTSATPTVRCVVGEHPGCVYNATKLSEGKYEVIIDLPQTMRAGAHDFKIEAVLNGRLFTPISTKIEVVGGYSNEVTDERVVELEPADPHMPPVVGPPKVEPPKVKESLIKDAAKKSDQAPQTSVAKPGQKPAMSALEKVAKAPVEKRKPKTVPVEPKAPVKFSMKDVANEAAKTHTKPAPVQETVVVEQITSIPISLTKGEVIYK